MGGTALQSDKCVSFLSAEMGFLYAVPKPLVFQRFVQRCLTLNELQQR